IARSISEGETTPCHPCPRQLMLQVFSILRTLSRVRPALCILGRDAVAELLQQSRARESRALEVLDSRGCGGGHPQLHRLLQRKEASLLPRRALPGRLRNPCYPDLNSC